MTGLPKSLESLINYFERLPGIGPKSATRLGFYLLNTPKEFVQEFGKVLVEMKEKIKFCRDCFSVAEDDLCEVCRDGSRNKRQICVVERAIDMVAIENVGGYKGVFHVLGGVINPLDHVGPDDLKIDELVQRVTKLIDDDADLEIILATNPTMEGEATALYIKRQLEEIKNFANIKVTRIGSGLPLGADLEFADAATLSRAIEGRRNL